MKNEKKYRHESYGCLDIYRSNGGQTTLFGSDLTHKNTIRMKISLSELTRGLNTDWYHPYDKLIEIEMSPVQFSEAITNMNTNGVPCTIKYYDGEYTEECPYRDKNEIFKEEFKDTIHGANNTTKKLINEVAKKFNEKKSFTKADKEEIMGMLNSLYQDLGSNMEYVQDCCQEQVNKTVVEAKGEIESYIMNRVNTLGLKALQEESQHLIEINECDK